jgi:hypothetical protein
MTYGTFKLSTAISWLQANAFKPILKETIARMPNAAMTRLTLFND